MIVEPDFFDHWKTQTLIQITNDLSAPLLVLRLWAHCQQRKSCRFSGISDNALASICRWTKAPSELRSALNDSGFIREKNGVLIVHDWEVTNRYLISAWKNGGKGGRPLKTDRKPTDNRPKTIPSNLSNLCTLVKEGVRGIFQEWIEHRMKFNKPKDPVKMFTEQAKWLSAFPEKIQCEIIGQSMRQGWQGLFPLKNNNGHRSEPPKKPAPTGPAYRPLPKTQSVSDEVRAERARQASELTTKLREQFRMPQ